MCVLSLFNLFDSGDGGGNVGTSVLRLQPGMVVIQSGTHPASLRSHLPSAPSRQLLYLAHPTRHAIAPGRGHVLDPSAPFDLPRTAPGVFVASPPLAADLTRARGPGSVARRRSGGSVPHDRDGSGYPVVDWRRRTERRATFPVVGTSFTRLQQQALPNALGNRYTFSGVVRRRLLVFIDPNQNTSLGPATAGDACPARLLLIRGDR